MPTVSAHVAVTLARHVDNVFGVMGNGNAWFLDAIERITPATFTAVRHEAGAVVAADAFHRASGRLARRPPPTARGSPTRSPRSRRRCRHTCR